MMMIIMVMMMVMMMLSFFGRGTHAILMLFMGSDGENHKQIHKLHVLVKTSGHQDRVDIHMARGCEASSKL